MDFVKKQGWHVSEKAVYDGYLSIDARNPKASLLRLFLCNEPQIAAWRLYPHGKETKIEMSFSLFKRSVLWFYSIFFVLFSALIVQAIYFFQNSSNIIALVRLLAAAAFCIVFHSCIADMRRYEKFRNGLFSSIREQYGLRETVIQEGLTFPEFNTYYFLLLSFMLPLLFFAGIFLFDLGSFFIPLIVSVFFILLLSLIFLSIVSLQNPNAGQRIRLVLVGLQGGFIFSLVSFIPLFHLLTLPFRDHPGVGFAISLSVLLIAFLIIFLSKNLYDTAIGLRASLSHYGVAEKELEYSLKPDKNNGSHSLGSAITAIWVLLSLSHVAGLCILLALLFNFSKMMLADRIMLSMFSLPIISFWLLLGYRKAKEAVYFIRLKNNSPASGGIVDKLNAICVFAGIDKPFIVVDKEDSIAANVKFIFPFGIFIRLTQRAMDELDGDELEALLAHEIFHVKKHGLAFSVMNFLSEWTLFGGGFLTLSQNSKEMEYDADRFALQWLSQNRKDRNILVSLLDKVSIVNSIGGLAYSQGAMNFIGSRPEKKSQTIHKFIDQLFFGDIILSYVHPTINERIERTMKS